MPTISEGFTAGGESSLAFSVHRWRALAYNNFVLTERLEFTPERDAEIFSAVPSAPAVFLLRRDVYKRQAMDRLSAVPLAGLLYGPVVAPGFE